ncbi:MAG: hypothetical protein H6696_15175 [Deferribacteres bacterium]|nr:hypothetical protein [candidate division KSB1 bacterium]MCB9503271.1 hypothetical protein [Deferribacteres bacterium]
MVKFLIPENCVRFRAFGGLDIGGTSHQGDGSTVEFMVSVVDPAPNLAALAVNIPVNLNALGFTGKCKIRDLWQQKDLGTYSASEFQPLIQKHGTGLYRITPVN